LRQVIVKTSFIKQPADCAQQTPPGAVPWMRV
jgi:hypothetical protein